MTRTPRFTVEQISSALEQSAGIRLGAAAILKCARSTISNHVNRSKKLQALEAEIIERNLDAAEGRVLKAIKDGNLTAAFFYLRTKGKHRGYSERQQGEDPDGRPVPVADQFDFTELSPAALNVAQAMMDELRGASRCRRARPGEQSSDGASAGTRNRNTGRSGRPFAASRPSNNTAVTDIMD